MSAELSARRTAAAAVLADYERAVEDHRLGIGPSDAATFAEWSGRLSYHVGSLLGQLDTETPGPLEQLGAEAVLRQLAQIRLVLDQVFGDEYADRQYAIEQIDDILRSGQ